MIIEFRYRNMYITNKLACWSTKSELAQKFTGSGKIDYTKHYRTLRYLVLTENIDNYEL